MPNHRNALFNLQPITGALAAPDYRPFRVSALAQKGTQRHADPLNPAALVGTVHPLMG